MYYLFPYRFSLQTSHLPAQRLRELAEAGQISLAKQGGQQAYVVRDQDSHEWLSPVIALRWDGPQLRVSLRPRRWLRRILQGEVVLLLGLMVALLGQASYFLGGLVLGLVLLNHSVIYWLMRRRFQEARIWVAEQFG
jgi:hypothetical protein